MTADLQAVGLAGEPQTNCLINATGWTPRSGPLSTTLYDSIEAFASRSSESVGPAVYDDGPQSGVGHRHQVCGHGQRLAVWHSGDGSVFSKIHRVSVGGICRYAVNARGVAHGAGPETAGGHIGTSFRSRGPVCRRGLSHGFGRARHHVIDELQRQLLQ